MMSASSIYLFRRSLCQMVKLGCESTMGRYGYPWPKMLDCANFPVDNDMCIRYGNWKAVACYRRTETGRAS